MSDRRPCACGRDGCVLVRRADEGPKTFSKRKYASYACANIGKARDPDFQARRLAGLRKAAAAKSGEIGALITPVEWLDLPPARLRIRAQAEGIVL